MTVTDDRISIDDVPLIADESWLHQQHNGNPPATDDDSWTPINLADLPAKPPIEPTLGGVGLVYPGKRHVFSGPQESAKTLCAYAVGIETIRQGGTLIVIDFEMGAYDARDRLRELGATDRDLQRFLYIEPAQPAQPHTAELLLQHDPQLVIVDAAAGAYDLQGLDDNKRADVEKFTTLYVRHFWRNGVATIVLDHVVKNTEGRGKYAIGSERKVGGADVHLGFEVITPIKRGGHGLYKIVTHKDRPGFLKRGKLADLELRSDEQHRITWEIKAASETDDDFRPTHLMEKISRYVEEMPDPVSRNVIETGVTGRAEYKRIAIDTLTRENYLVENLEGQARMYVSVKPYRESEEPPRPTSSNLVPDEAPATSSTSSPPYGGTRRGEGSSDDTTSSNDGIPF